MKKSYSLIAAGLLAAAFQQSPVLADGVPEFKVDPFWPKPLPENWMLGQVSGIAVDKDDRVWIVHRPATLVDDEKGALANPPTTKCCKPAPPVLQFDAQGNLLKSWGGKGAGYDWPESEHGIHVDAQGNVWLAGNGPRTSRSVFTPGRQVPAPARQARRSRRLEQPERARASGAHGGRWRRALRRRRLCEPARGGVRRAHARLQAPLGRLRREAARRQAPALRSARRARALVRQPGALRARRLATGWSTSATAPTTASRSSTRAASS